MSTLRAMVKDPLFIGWLLAEGILFAGGLYAAGFIVSGGYAVWQVAHHRGYAEGLDVGYRNYMRSIDLILAERERQILELTAPDDPARRVIAQQRAQVQKALRDGVRAASRPDDSEA